jgi:hypothetical protein
VGVQIVEAQLSESDSSRPTGNTNGSNKKKCLHLLMRSMLR